MNKQKTYKVKLTYQWDPVIMRQTPKWSGIWENYEFVVNDDVTACDFWIVFSKYGLVKETCDCPPENIILVTWEPSSIEQFGSQFLKQFGLIVTSQKEIKHPNVINYLTATPWFVDKNYDELIEMATVKKTKKISIISSNKAVTDGHKKRLDFVYKLKNYFGEEIDLFGRGINDFDNKWDVLAPYKYSLAIENDFCEDYITEKFFDCQLAFTYPLYYGCPNAEKYFSDNCFSRININDFNASIMTIENILNDDLHYENHLQHVQIARLQVLNKYNIFPMLVSLMRNMNGQLTPQHVAVLPESVMEKVLLYLKRIFR